MPDPLTSYSDVTSRFEEVVLAPPFNARAQYVAVVIELFDKSRQTFSPYFRKLQRLYDLYRGATRLRTDPGWNNVHVPLLFSVVQSDVARKCQMLFGGTPTLAFIPSGQEDNEKARKMERLIEMQLNDAGTYQKAVRFLMNADLYGVSTYRYSWKRTYGSQRRRNQREAPTATPPGAHLRFNGPDWEHVDQTDFFPYPGVIDISEMPGVVHRYYMDYEDIVLGSQVGPGGELPLFDSAGVAQLGNSSPSPMINDERAYRRNLAAGGMDDATWARLTQFAKPVEILEYWGRVPRGMALRDPETGEDGVTEVVITVADRNHLLRAVPIQFWDRTKPFGAYRPFEDPHFFHAPGKVEIGEKLQAATNRIANTKLDALDLYISPPWVYNENSGINTRRLMAGPGALIGVNGPVDETQLRQLLPDLRGLSAAGVEIEQHWRWMQQATGIIEDVSQGMQSGGSDRQTAHEYLGRAEAVSTRLALETRLAEQQWLEPLGNAFVEMNRQFLPFPQEMRMLGSNAVWDAVEGRFMPPEPFTITGEDLDQDYDVRATGATRMIGKQAKVMNMQSAVQMLGVNPQVAATVNWLIFVRQYLTLLDITNVDQVMNNEAQMMQAMAVWQQIQGKAGAPGAPGGVAGPMAMGMPSAGAPAVPSEFMGGMGTNALGGGP